MGNFLDADCKCACSLGSDVSVSSGNKCIQQHDQTLVIEMCFSAANGNLERIRKLIAEGVEINQSDYDHRTALHLAAGHGHCNTVQLLIDAKADVRMPDRRGHTALDDAARGGYADIQAVLRIAGAIHGDTLRSPHVSPSLLPRPGMKPDLDLDCLKQYLVSADEVQLDQVLSTTLKSTIYTGIWRGTKIVAKTSGNMSAGMSRSDSDSEDSVQALGAKEILHEMKLISTMRHPDLLLFLAACLDHSPMFFLTEFMESGDLESYYTKKSRQTGHPYRPSWQMFLKWASAIARALSFLHNCTQPVIHRDLKPKNLLLTKGLDLKLSDFGTSKVMHHKVSGAVLSPTEPVMSGGVGTWRYMAPEVVRYECYTDRVDIYSFALIMWFMSTGLDPFVEQFGNDAEIVLKEYLKGKEPRPDVTYSGARCGPSLPKDLHQFIKDCWHPCAQSRPAAMECTQRLTELGVPGSAMSSLTKFFRGSS